MSDRNFRQLLEAQLSRRNSVCVGLNSEYGKIPLAAASRVDFHGRTDVANTIINFNRAIVEATNDLVCAYMLNSAFYEAYGDVGYRALRDTIVCIHDVAPEVPVILDAKRGDISEANAGYVSAAFGFLQADAITVHPYPGAEALKPFLDRADKGIFVLCRTSNPRAGEFQDRMVIPSYEDEERWKLGSGPRGESEPTHMPPYKYVAHAVANDWNKNNNCGLVVGATYPDELREVRKIVGDMPILIPDISAQGGDLEKTVTAGKDSRGKGVIINSPRDIIFASKDADFAEAARRETETLRDLINQY